MASAAPLKPVIVAVEDDRGDSMVAVLEPAYADACVLHVVSSGDAALELLNDLALREEPVALLLADQRLPGTGGSELLRRARHLAPGAKTVLVTTREDAAEAIDASNELNLDAYAIRETDVRSVLSRLLREWQESYRPPPRAKVVASRFSEESHAVRDFLARNHVDYTWLDAERDQEAGILFARARPATADLPILFFDDGTWLQRPTTREV